MGCRSGCRSWAGAMPTPTSSRHAPNTSAYGPGWTATGSAGFRTWIGPVSSRTRSQGPRPSPLARAVASACTAVSGLSPERIAAVDDKRGAGHVARCRRGEIAGERPDLLRLPGAAHRDGADEGTDHFGVLLGPVEVRLGHEQ